MLDLIEAVSTLEEGQKPDPEKRIGRKCYAFSPTEDKAFALIEDKARQLFTSEGIKTDEYKIETDAIGNLFITLFGEDHSQRVMSGSHADSVLNGGKYDGMAGVNSAFNFLSSLVQSGNKPKKSFTMAVFRAEESSPKTGVACLGSRIATGTITADDLEKINYKLDDGTSISLHQYFAQKFGSEKWTSILEEIKNPPINAANTLAYEELHIEQSAVIETAKADVGIVVDGIGGAIRKTVSMPLTPEMLRTKTIDKHDPHFKISFSFMGEEAHTGGTPPNPMLRKNRSDFWYRKDALFAASEFTRLFFRLAASAGLSEKIMLTDFSMPRELGFTTVPPNQTLEITAPEAAQKALKKIAEICISRVTDNNGVRIIGNLSQVPPGEITHYDHKILKTLQIPIAVEKISRRTVNEQVSESGGVGRIRGTVTDFRVTPDQLKFNLDFRDVDTEAISQVSELVNQKIAAVSEKMQPEIKTVSSKKFTPLDPAAAEIKRELARQLNIMPVELPSLPGHDGDPIGKTGVPVTMTFVRHNGKSHNPEENVDPDDYASAEKLSHAYLRKMVGIDE